MSDKYEEASRKIWDISTATGEWNEYRDACSAILREMFPASSGQGEDERQTAHASNCSILPECKCKREALVPKDARELMLRIDLANRHPRFTIEQGADEIDRFAQARIREAAQGDDDRLIVIRNYVENAPRKSVYDKQARLYALEAIDALRSRPAEPITRSCQNCGARNAGCVGSDKGICDNWGPWPEPAQAAPSEEDMRRVLSGMCSDFERAEIMTRAWRSATSALASERAKREGAVKDCGSCRWGGYDLCAMPLGQACVCKPSEGDYSSWTPKESPARLEEPKGEDGDRPRVQMARTRAPAGVVVI